MDANTVIEMLGKRLRLAVIGERLGAAATEGADGVMGFAGWIGVSGQPLRSTG